MAVIQHIQQEDKCYSNIKPFISPPGYPTLNTQKIESVNSQLVLERNLDQFLPFKLYFLTNLSHISTTHISKNNIKRDFKLKYYSC